MTQQKQSSMTTMLATILLLLHAVYNTGADPHLAEDCLVGAGESYRGTVSETETGNTCQRWDSQTPHGHDRTPANYPSSGLEENYCRNPDGEPGVWCYTTDPSTRWDFCNVPLCDTGVDCNTYFDGESHKYNVTCPSGCSENRGFVWGIGRVWGTGVYMRFSSICRAAIHDGRIPSSGGQVTVYRWPGQDSYIGSLQNGIQSFGWGSFYSSFVFRPAEDCLIGNGASYRGTVSVTETGNTCQRWDSQTPHGHDRTPANYRSSGLEENYCRNPDGEPGVWCYTTDPSTIWAFCNVPLCDTVNCITRFQDYGDESHTHNVTCPSGCSENRGFVWGIGSVWGTGVYMRFSSICRAAIHDGRITDSGGQVTVYRWPGQDSYIGSQQNGIQSFGWPYAYYTGRWGISFAFRPDDSTTVPWVGSEMPSSSTVRVMEQSTSSSIIKPEVTSRHIEVSTAVPSDSVGTEMPSSVRVMEQSFSTSTMKPAVTSNTGRVIEQSSSISSVKPEATSNSDTTSGTTLHAAKTSSSPQDEEKKTPPWLVGVVCAAVVVIVIIAVVTVLLCRRKHNPGANVPGKSGNEMKNLDTPERHGHAASEGSVDNIIYNTEDEGFVDNVIYNAGDDGTVDNVIYQGQDSKSSDQENAPESQYESVK